MTTLKHIERDIKQGSYGIFTSWRKSNSKLKNLEDLDALQNDLKDAGLRMARLKGQWPECQDPNIPYKDCPKELLVTTRERSLFVPGISKDLIIDLMAKYQQNSVMYSGPETGGQAIFIDNDGTEYPAGNFQTKQVGDFFSRIKGKPFTFKITEWLFPT